MKMELKPMCGQYEVLYNFKKFGIRGCRRLEPDSRRSVVMMSLGIFVADKF